MGIKKLDEDWAAQERKLSKDTQTKIKKSKITLSPDLEKFAKVSGYLRNDLDAKTAKLFDAGKKLEKQIRRACDDILDIVDRDNTKEERNAEKLLKRIQKEVETDFLQIKKRFVATTTA